MISDLIDSDSAHIGTLRLGLNLAKIELNELVRRVVASAQTLAEGRRIVLRRTGRACWIKVDPVRIEQVLENLLSNAVKYGDPGYDIEVECEQRDEEVWISVLNHRRVSLPEEAATLILPSGRSRSARKSGPPGLACGWHICKGLVEAHGGRIWVESSPDGITAFRIALPLLAEDVVLESSGLSPEAGISTGDFI
jgi:signal transduction histidine kinase